MLSHTGALILLTTFLCFLSATSAAPWLQAPRAVYGVPHEGDGQDYHSAGIFRQRPTWWGTVQELMNPTTSTKKFYAALAAVPGWEAMSRGDACQAVQKSERPDRYAKWERTGRAVCDAIWKEKQTGAVLVAAVPVVAESVVPSTTVSGTPPAVQTDDEENFEDDEEDVL